jgi:hypothetical protein
MSSVAAAGHAPRVSSSIPWLVWRQLALITRTPAFWTATAVYVTLLSLFLLVWGDGVPAMTGTLLDQFTTIQVAALGLILPWAAARVALESRRDLTTIAALACCSPAQLIVSQYVASMLALCVLVLCALPMMLVASQIAAADAAHLVRQLPRLLALCASAAGCVSIATAIGGTRIISWLFSTVALIVVAGAGGRGIEISLLVVAIAAALPAGAAVHANRALKVSA